MEFTFIPYEPGAEQLKNAVDALPANSSTSTPTVTDIAAPEAGPGIDLAAPAPTSVLGPPPSALEPPAPSPPVLHTNTRPVPFSSVLNDVNMYGSSSSEDSDNDRDDDNSNDDDSNDEGTSRKKKHKKDDFVEIPQDGVPPGQAGVESWHGRNPDRPAIPLRNHRPKQNVETLETARLKREANKQTAAKLTDAIQNIVDVRNKMAEEVAEAHNVKVELVLRRLMSLGSMKASRKISLFNAKVHHLSHPAVGRPIKLKEARRRVRLDPEWEDMDEEAEQALRDELMQHHELKKHGARATPTACMVDARFTTESIAQEMTALAERTGMIGFGFFTRTHIHDKTVPVEIESWGALEFLSQVLRMDPRDVGAKFELWAIARDKGKSLSSSGKEVVQYHEEGIRAKGRKNLRLNWKQYWTVMVVKHRLILRGWPLHDRGPCNPKLIHTIESIREVRDALKDGSSFWHRLTDPEWEREKAKVEQMLEDGDIEATKRKVRSDKNTKKTAGARRVWNEESEEETEKETEMVKAKKKKSKKRSRAEGDDRNRDEPPKKKKRTLKSSKSASDNPDRFQEMQKKLRTLAKAKRVSTQLPPVIRGSRRPGPPGVRATPEELASVR
ncbi:hypothetical protein C8F04DRAFT_1267402 [Mycena alexandri]|uniref:Uncharacterized protein n=1 Tax=Mycena alexandri TaxID=1745969 RepID=A0AAD6WXK9_9AGAR|nr:hypothetical protein C8F04DRAFT_1267402 [Mycena alexandri]